MEDKAKSKAQLIAELEGLREQTRGLAIQAREEIAQVKDYLDTVLMNLPVGVAILEGPEFRYFRINQNLADLNGVPISDHLGNTVADVLPDAASVIIPELRRVLETGKPILRRKFSVLLPRSSKPVRMIGWHVPIQRNAESSPSGVVSVVLDVTELDETQSQLQQSQKMEALGTLAGGIAHDFNNILGSILGNTEMLAIQLPQDSEWRGYLENISSSGERAANLVRQIMTFSRMDVASYEPLDLSSEILESLKMIRSTIPRNIEIRQNLPENCPSILADVTQMHQIILNLVSNAVQAMDETGGVLDITLDVLSGQQVQEAFSDSKSRCLRLTFRDSGPGIGVHDQARVFDPFFTTKVVGKGTGLGLAVVDSIVRKHHGKIILQSGDCDGTTFILYFPIAPDQVHQPRGTEKVVRRPLKRHILIAEDETALADLYMEYLEGTGYRVTVCEDGIKALALFKDHPGKFDLVLTDYSMPNITGKELIGKLLEVRPDIPIILSSGYHDLIDENETEKLGVKQCLMKPLKLKMLKETIDRYVTSPV